MKLNLKPDTELGDLIAWISSITCKQFLLPGTIPANSKKVTVVAPELITPEEAYRLFLGALDSAGLDRRALGQVRAHRRDRARSRPWAASLSTARTPTFPSSESYVTRLVHVENVDPNEVSQVLSRIKGEQGDIVVFAPQNALIITDLASNIKRMLKVLARSTSRARARRSGSSASRTPPPPTWRRSWARSSRCSKPAKKGAGAPPPAAAGGPAEGR